MSDSSRHWILLALSAAPAVAAVLLLSANIERPHLPGRRGERRDLIDAGVALAAAIVAWLVISVVWQGFGGNFFGGIRLLWLGAVLWTPLVCGFALLRWPLSTAARIVAIGLTLALPAIGVRGSFIEPRQLTLESATLTVPPERAGVSSLRIAVLADLQTDEVGEHEARAVEMTIATRPHLVLLPGDFLQADPERYAREVPRFRTLLTRLATALASDEEALGVFAVPGNCEPDLERARALFEGTGVHWLFNEIVRHNVLDRRLVIGGVELRRSDATRELITRLVGEASLDEIRILIAHYPDHVLDLPADSGVDLVVAGHTHGGQVVVPGFGPPITLSRVPRSVAAGGLHAHRGNVIYVSRGVGMERGEAPPLRLFCPPEVSLITLR